MFISFLCRRLPGDRDPGLFSLLPHHNIFNLTHQGVHIDEEQGGWEGKKRGVFHHTIMSLNRLKECGRFLTRLAINSITVGKKKVNESIRY